MTEPTYRDRFERVVRTEPVDLGMAALLIGAHARPAEADHDLQSGVQTLEALAASVAASGAAADRLRQTLRDFHGNADVYRNLDSSLLSQVLRTHRGLPILLSVVWLEVARRAGIPAHGIGLPGHFVVGVGDPDGFRELVDPFHKGRLIHASDAQRLAGRDLSPAELRPWDAVEILQRILNNIRLWADRPDLLPTRRWALELTLLLPRHPLERRRELGAVLVQQGGFLEGAIQLERYAEEAERADVQAAELARRAAGQARARLN